MRPQNGQRDAHPTRCGRNWLLLLAGIVLLPAMVFSQDNNNVRAIRLSDVEGTVQLLDSSGIVFDQAHPNMPVTEGMHLKTSDNGRVEVQFEDGSVARATPNSSIQFPQLQRTSEGKTVTQIDAVSGLSYYEINNRGGEYSVDFGPYKITAAQSSVFRVKLDQNPAQVSVMHGEVHIETGNSNGLDVKANETASLDMKDASSYDVAQEIPPDSWDQWNSDRDQYLSQLGAKATMARSDSGNPDDPAWNDLDYYGSWYDMPGYGMGWMPAGVDAGWDPFGSGYWGYYPSYGYTWISSNPWGWYPYHCGAWNWFNGPGWMWFPGGCGWGAFGHGWYPVATVWNLPPNYQLPKRPRVNPARGPVHMPPQQALISITRGSVVPAPVQRIKGEGPKAIATPIRFDGKTIHPVERVVQPRSGGPLGEGFSVSSGGMGSLRSGIHVAPVNGAVASPATPGIGRETYVPVNPLPGNNRIGGGLRNTMAPPVAPRTIAPPRAIPMPPSSPPVFHSAPMGNPGGMSAPHYSAPSAPAAPHISAPAPSAGGGVRAR